jgi:WD40 repeat protein
LSSHECVGVYTDHQAPVCALAWHSKRRQLLSSCENQRLRIWELAGEGRRTVVRSTETVASCVASTPAYDPSARSPEALHSYALAVCPAPSGLQLICGLEDGSVVVLL